MSTEDKKRKLHQQLITRVLEGDGRAASSQRGAAFMNVGLTEPLSTLINKVAMQAHKVTDHDIHAVKESGLTEDQIFELIISAAIGQATRQYETALAALDAVIKGEMV